MKTKVYALLVFVIIMVFGSPQSGHTFEPDCHYAWTYYLALHVGYSPRQAYQIASAAYAIDEDKDTGPMEATLGDVVFGANHPGLVGLKQPHPKISGIWKRFHAFSLEGERGKQVTATKKVDQDYLWEIALKQKNPGPLIHYTQDIYSHSGWDNYNGHAAAGHKPDYLSNDPNYSEIMTYDTIRVLQQFRDRAFPGRDWVKSRREPDMTRIREVLKRLFEANPAPWQASPTQYVPVGEIGRPDLVPAIQVLNAAIKEDQASGQLPRFGEDLEGRPNAQLPDSILIPDHWHQFDFDNTGQVQAPLLQGYSVELPRIFVSDAKPQIKASETYTTLSGSTIQIRLPYEIEGTFEHKPLGEITVAIKEFRGADPGNTEISKLDGYFHTVQVKNGKYEVDGSFGVRNKDLLKGQVWIGGLQIDGLKPIITKVVIPCDQNVMDQWIGKIYDEAMAISGGRSCSVLEDSVSLMKEIVENSACPRAFEAQAKIVSVSNKIEASKNAARQLQTAVESTQGFIKRCDAAGATSMIAVARQALSQMTCQPADGPIFNENSIADLEYDRNSIQRDQQDFLKKIGELKANAEDAATRCDAIDAESAAKKLENEIARYSEKCPALPEATEASTRVQELLNTFKNGEAAKVAIQEADDALKQCDVLGGLAAADQLEFVGGCGINGKAEADRIRTEAAAIAKMQEALTQNVSAVLENARKAWTPACDFAGVRVAHSEMNRIVEPFAMKCPEYPPGISSDVLEVQKIFESAEQQVSAEREIKAKYDQAQTAWKACKVADAIKLVDEMDQIQVPNAYCKSDRQLAGSFKADALFYGGHLEQMLDAIDSADEMLKGCPADSRPIEQQLRKAESHLSTLSSQANSMNCDLNVPRAAISEIRKSAQQLGSSRKAIGEKIGMADGLLNAAASNPQSKEKAEQYLQEAEGLLEKAYPPECFEDLAMDLDNVQGVIDLLAQADEVLEEDPEEEDFGEDEMGFGDDEEIDEPLDIEEIPEDEGTAGEDGGVIDDLNPPTVTNPPVSGPTWTFQSVEVTPAVPWEGWTFSANSTNATISLNGGVYKIDYQWTAPPSQINMNGFGITIGANAKAPPPNQMAAGVIGVGGEGIDSDTPDDQLALFCTAKEGGTESCQRTIQFKPLATAGDIKVKIGIHWAINFTYYYKRNP
jgi:hypothetical protein